MADPKAVVTIGNARFTVLTPQLIRMEWSADGKFEDHASLVFFNRRMPVPKFDEDTTARRMRGALTIKTDALTLDLCTARPTATSRPTDLSIALTVDGKKVVWHPGDTDPENLEGTTRTLDGARGNKTRSPSGRGWFRARDGRWSTTQRARSSTPPTFASSTAKRARGRG